MFRWCSHTPGQPDPHLPAEAGRLRLCWLPTPCQPRKPLCCTPVSSLNPPSPFYPLARVLRAVSACPRSLGSLAPANKFPRVSGRPLLAGGCSAGREPWAAPHSRVLPQSLWPAAFPAGAWALRPFSLASLCPSQGSQGLLAAVLPPQHEEGMHDLRLLSPKSSFMTLTENVRQVNWQ